MDFVLIYVFNIDTSNVILFHLMLLWCRSSLSIHSPTVACSPSLGATFASILVRVAIDLWSEKVSDLIVIELNEWYEKSSLLIPTLSNFKEIVDDSCNQPFRLGHIRVVGGMSSQSLSAVGYWSVSEWMFLRALVLSFRTCSPALVRPSYVTWLRLMLYSLWMNVSLHCIGLTRVSWAVDYDVTAPSLQEFIAEILPTSLKYLMLARLLIKYALEMMCLVTVSKICAIRHFQIGFVSWAWCDNNLITSLTLLLRSHSCIYLDEYSRPLRFAFLLWMIVSYWLLERQSELLSKLAVLITGVFVSPS